MRGRPGNLWWTICRAAGLPVIRTLHICVLVVTVWVCSRPLYAQQIRKADTVAPEDLGFTMDIRRVCEGRQRAVKKLSFEYRVVSAAGGSG